MNINDFNCQFYEKLEAKLSCENYVFKKSKKIFEYNKDGHIFTLEAFTVRMSSAIIVKINGFYSSEKFNNLIKRFLDQYYSIQTKYITGGSAAFISEYFFNEKFINDTNDFWWYEGEESIDSIVEKWYEVYFKYLKPFLNKCKDINFLNKLINEYKIDECGFIAGGYNNRVLKGLILAYMADNPIDKIESLALSYETVIRNKKLSFLKSYLTVKNKFIDYIKLHK